MKRVASKQSTPQPEVDQVSDGPLQAFMGYHIKRAFNVIQADLNDVLRAFD